MSIQNIIMKNLKSHITKEVKSRTKSVESSDNFWDDNLNKSTLRQYNSKVNSEKSSTIYSRGINKMSARKEKLKELKNNEIQNELKGCTFKPTVNTRNISINYNSQYLRLVNDDLVSMDSSDKNIIFKEKYEKANKINQTATTMLKSFSNIEQNQNNQNKQMIQFPEETKNQSSNKTLNIRSKSSSFLNNRTDGKVSKNGSFIDLNKFININNKKEDKCYYIYDSKANIKVETFKYDKKPVNNTYNRFLKRQEVWSIYVSEKKISLKTKQSIEKLNTNKETLLFKPKINNLNLFYKGVKNSSTSLTSKSNCQSSSLKSSKSYTNLYSLSYRLRDDNQNNLYNRLNKGKLRNHK
jgi:hypothetical protein